MACPNDRRTGPKARTSEGWRLATTAPRSATRRNQGCSPRQSTVGASTSTSRETADRTSASVTGPGQINSIRAWAARASNRCAWRIWPPPPERSGAKGVIQVTSTICAAA